MRPAVEVTFVSEHAYARLNVHQNLRDAEADRIDAPVSR